MKKIVFTTLSVFICLLAFAQTMQDVPQKISYSGVVNKKVGDKHVLVKNTEVDFKVVIKQGGSIEFTEEHNGVQVNGKGQVAFEIGKGTNQNQAFNTLKWHLFDNPIIDVNIKEGGNQLAEGNVIIRTVPYVFHAQTARYYVDKNGNFWEMGGEGSLVPAVEPEPPVEIDPDLPGGPQTKNGNLDENHAFVRLARFNVKQDADFIDKHSVAENDNGYFTFEQAKGLNFPTGYVLPDRFDFNEFLADGIGDDPTANFPKFSTPNISVYKKIGDVHFRYTYKSFNSQEGSYLEILATKGGTEADAKLKLDTNDNDVAARYFPAGGYKTSISVPTSKLGQNGDYWSSTVFSSTKAYHIFFTGDAASVNNFDHTHLFCVRPILASKDPDRSGGPQSKDGNLGENHAFVRLAKFNLKQDGSSMANHSNVEVDNGFFDFDQAKEFLSFPNNYTLPTKADINEFMLDYGKGNPYYSFDNPAYKMIAGVYFRYAYKKFYGQDGAYLEILAVKAASEEQAKSMLDANSHPKVAARYFAATGFRDSASEPLIDPGVRSRFWASSVHESSSDAAWCLAFSAEQANTTYHKHKSLFPVRIIRKP